MNKQQSQITKVHYPQHKWESGDETTVDSPSSYLSLHPTFRLLTLGQVRVLGKKTRRGSWRLWY